MQAHVVLGRGERRIGGDGRHGVGDRRGRGAAEPAVGDVDGGRHRGRALAEHDGGRRVDLDEQHPAVDRSLAMPERQRAGAERGQLEAAQVRAQRSTTRCREPALIGSGVTRTQTAPTCSLA
jgi:hypothetical protein